LVVMGILALMMALMVPAFNGIKGGQDVTTTNYNIAGLLEQARKIRLRLMNRYDTALHT